MTRSRPARFARYKARSARSITAATWSSPGRKVATPSDAVTPGGEDQTGSDTHDQGSAGLYKTGCRGDHDQTGNHAGTETEGRWFA